MGLQLRQCVAFLEEHASSASVYVRCGERTKTHKGSRFCRAHEQAYREIILGILMQGGRNKPPRSWGANGRPVRVYLRSQETRQKISATMKARGVEPSLATLRKAHSAESRQKISATLKARGL
jgi:hypothetical protein